MDWEQKEPGRNPRPKESERRRKPPQSGQGTRRDPSRREQEETRRRREEQQRRRREQQRKRRKQARRAQRSAQRRQEAQRTPARPLPRRKLVRKLVTTLAVVAALILGLTIFFKVRTVRVTGNVKYTAQEVTATVSSATTNSSLLPMLPRAGLPTSITARPLRWSC